MIKKLRTINITFDNALSFSEITKFRGAIINKLENKDISYLFHNHTQNGYRYKYPLIQYKVFNKKASIICLDDGVEQIHDFFNQGNHKLSIGDREETFNVKRIKINEFTMQVWDKWFYYSLINWLALNPENHKKLENLKSESEKETFLENILKANILSFAKGIDWTVEKPIDIKINKINKTGKIKFKEQFRLYFNLEFKTNVFLPNFIGLGKGVSIGFGTVKQTNGK